jgi:RDD family
MQIRVVPAKGEGTLKPRRAVARCIGLVLAALPLFAGFALILFDHQRRGLQDRLARTVVIEAPALSAADVRRQQRALARAIPQVAGASVEADRSSDRGEDIGGDFAASSAAGVAYHASRGGGSSWIAGLTSAPQ